MKHNDAVSQFKKIQEAFAATLSSLFLGCGTTVYFTRDSRPVVCVGGSWTKEAFIDMCKKALEHFEEKT